MCYSMTGRECSLYSFRHTHATDPTFGHSHWGTSCYPIDKTHCEGHIHTHWLLLLPCSPLLLLLQYKCPLLPLYSLQPMYSLSQPTFLSLYSGINLNCEKCLQGSKLFQSRSKLPVLYMEYISIVYRRYLSWILCLEWNKIAVLTYRLYFQWVCLLWEDHLMKWRKRLLRCALRSLLFSQQLYSRLIHILSISIVNHASVPYISVGKMTMSIAVCMCIYYLITKFHHI